MKPSRLAALVTSELASAQQIAYAQISPDLRILQASDNFIEMLSEPETPIDGLPISDLILEFVGSEDRLQRVLLGELPDYRLPRVNKRQPDGSIRYVDLRVIRLDGGGTGGGLLLIAVDSTQEGELERQLVQDRNELRLMRRNLAQANEELQSLNRLKSLFLSMAAHDLRAPLSAIFGYAELLRVQLSEEMPDEGRVFLSIITTQIDRMNRLIADLLDLDQIEQGAFQVSLRPCDLKPILREITELMKEPARRGQITLSLKLPQPPVPLYADPERLRQIFYNLLSNAIKYTGPGGTVDVVAQLDGDFGVVQVIDTGRGMNEAEQQQLFQIYYRTEEARGSEVKGTGLGLFIVKNLVEAHKGHVEVESEPGRGTAFSVRLPLAAGD